jgi:hypothetical protein
VRRSESRNGHHPVDIDSFCDEGLANRELIGGERTGLVGAENIDTLAEYKISLDSCMMLWRNSGAELCLRCTCEAYNHIDGDRTTLKIPKSPPQLQNCNWKSKNPGDWSDWVWGNGAEMI